MKFKLRIIKDESLEEGRQEKKWIEKQNFTKEEKIEWELIELDDIKVSDMAWIKARRGDKEIAEVAEYVVKFREDSVQKKLKDNGYDTNLSKKNPKHTFEYLKKIIDDIEEASESNKQYDEIIKDPSQVEFLGKVGNWEVLMPKTQRGSISCDISGEDTTWCTTKKGGQNLFYSYVGRTITDITLFYVMDYTRTPKMGEGKSGEILCIKDCDARLAIGWDQNGMRLDGKRGGLSVNAGNEGLKMKIKKIGRIDGDNPKATVDKQRSILEIFDSSEWKQIEQLMNDAWESIDKGRLHPAKEMLKKAAGNLILLKQLTKDYKKEEKRDFFKMILDQESISQDVEMFLIDQDVDMAIAVTRYTPHPETLVKAYEASKKYDSTDLVYHVLYRSETPASIFKEVAKDEVLLKNKNIQTRMASDKRSPPEVFLKLLELTFDKQTINRIGRNPYATPEVIEAVIMHDQAGPLVWRSLLTDRPDDIPMKALEYLANLDEFPPRTSKIAKKVLAARQGQLEETSTTVGMAGFPVPPTDEVNEMYSTSALTGRNYRIKISGRKERAGHVERSKHQGLKNVMENDNEGTLSFAGPTELSDFGSNLQDLSPTARKAVKDAGYKFVDYLGGGQFGKVFKVNNPAMNREEAIKIVTGTPNSTNREVRNYKMIQDARTKSDTISKHFPETYAAWKQDGFGFVAMEILEPVQYSDEAMLVDRTNLRSARESDSVPYTVPQNQSFKAKQWFDTTFLDSLKGSSDKIETHALQGLQVTTPIDNGDLLFYTSPTFMSGLKAQAESFSPEFYNKADEHLEIFMNTQGKLSFPKTSRILGIVKDETPDAEYIAVSLGVISNVILNIRGKAQQELGQQVDTIEIDNVIASALIPFVKGYREFSTMRVGYDKKGPKVATGTEKESWDKIIKELYDLTGLVARDVHYGNVMQRPNGDLVIVDLGLFKMKGDTPGLFESKKYRLKILTKPKK